MAAVFAHPDDEAYSAAATLALCAKLGARVEIISATRGEAGSERSRRGYPAAPAAVAALRSRELEAACRVIGTRPPRFLELPDGELADLDPEAIGSVLASVLLPIDPQIIITHGRDGAYAHRDHLAVCSAVSAAHRLLPRTRGRRVLHAAFPRDLFVDVWRALRRHPGIVEPGWDPACFGIDSGDAAFGLRLDRKLAELKRSAIACHDSQLERGDPRSFLRLGLVDPLLEEEWFTVGAGPPLPAAAPHPFAGLEASR